jgi:hypothetical protein
MTASGRSNPSNIKVRPTGVGHFNGLICVACAWLYMHEHGMMNSKGIHVPEVFLLRYAYACEITQDWP